MNRKHFLIICVLIFILTLAACQGVIPSSIAETPSVPQTIEGTQIVQSPAASIESEAETASREPTIPLLSFPVPAGTTSVELDPAYFDGFIALTQYYTLLGHGLYQESYQMLSSSQNKFYNLEDYTSFYTHDMKSLEIDGIQPYNYWREIQSLPALQIPSNELRFVVFLTTFHHGAAWNKGGTPIPDNVTGFQSLVWENDEWKIDEYNTMPWVE